MKLYDFRHAPNPRIVRICFAEKGIEHTAVQVDLRAGEQYSPAFRAVTPRCTVPVLELDSGTRILDSTAICDYLETLCPEPRLLGANPEQKAVILSWHLWNQAEGIGAAGEWFRNASPLMKDRRRPGLESWGQNELLAKRGQQRCMLYAEQLEQRLQKSAWVGGDGFSLADISALVAVDFAKRMDFEPPAALTQLTQWHARVSARPGSAS